MIEESDNRASTKTNAKRENIDVINPRNTGTPQTMSLENREKRSLMCGHVVVTEKALHQSAGTYFLTPPSASFHITP